MSINNLSVGEFPNSGNNHLQFQFLNFEGWHKGNPIWTCQNITDNANNHGKDDSVGRVDSALNAEKMDLSVDSPIEKTKAERMDPSNDK